MAFETSPTPLRRNAYAQALAWTGQRAQAIALLNTWLAEASTENEAKQSRVAATIRVSRWLQPEGRFDEAIAKMRAALAGPLGREASAGDIVLNLVPALLLAHKPDQALELLDAQSTELALLTAYRSCALKDLGRDAEAATFIMKMKTVHARSVETLGVALGCAGSLDELAPFWIGQLENVESRASALHALQVSRFRRQAGLAIDSLGDLAARRVLDRADVRQVENRLGRPLPVKYHAVLSNFSGLAEPTPTIPAQP